MNEGDRSRGGDAQLVNSGSYSSVQTGHFRGIVRQSFGRCSRESAAGVTKIMTKVRYNAIQRSVAGTHARISAK
jgi:hypothetical protein